MDKETNYLALPAKRKGEWQAVIEIPKGSRKKRAVHKGHPTEVIIEDKVKKPFMCAYGFIPSTDAKDGECVDVFVFGHNLKSLDVIDISIMGMIRVCDNGIEDNKVIACAQAELVNPRDYARLIKYLKKKTRECQSCHKQRVCGKEETEHYLERRMHKPNTKIKQMANDNYIA